MTLYQSIEIFWFNVNIPQKIYRSVYLRYERCGSPFIRLHAVCEQAYIKPLVEGTYLHLLLHTDNALISTTGKITLTDGEEREESETMLRHTSLHLSPR